MKERREQVIETLEQDGVTVVSVNVDMDAMTVEEIAKAVDSLLLSDHKRIIVDLEKCGRVDSSGFGAMVAMQVLAQNRLSRLAYTGLNSNIMKTMKMLRLNDQLDIYNDRPEALEALKQGRLATMQRTLILLKPDAVQRQLVGEIIARFERRGLKIVGLKMLMVSEELAGEHYAEHVDKPFFGELVEFITSTPVVAAALEGENAVSLVRNMMGALEPAKAQAGTVRADYTCSKQKNLVHGSDSPESAQRELALWFKPDELIQWERALDPWMV